MAEIRVIYWRDIPAQVMARAGRKTVKRMLNERFEKAIDMASMRAGLATADDYLAEWRKSDAVECSSDLEMEADAWVTKLENDFPQERLVSLANAFGRNENTPDKNAD